MNGLIFEGRLIARTPLHPGAGRGGDLADLMLRRDAGGRVLIPGTGIAGAMRTLATRLAPGLGMDPCKALVTGVTVHCHCPVCRLFGELTPSTQSTGTASRLWFHHAPAPADLSPRVQDGVGIARDTRTAARAAAAKFDSELIPGGTAFPLRIVWEDVLADGTHATEGIENPADQEARLLAACFAEWQAGRLWLGGGTARGLGALTLEGLVVHSQQLSEPQRLMAFLQAEEADADPLPGDDWVTARLEPSAAERGRGLYLDGAMYGFAELSLTLACDAEVLFNDLTTAVSHGYDHAPLVEAAADGLRLVLPGSGLRGVLRAQAERIARTLTTLAAADLEDFGRHCPACDPNARPPGAESPAHHPLASCSALDAARLNRAAKGAGSKEPAHSGQLCLGCQLFGSTLFGSRLRVEGGTADLPRQDATRIRDFVAIDRFTGGAKDQAKFDALVPAAAPVFPARLMLENPRPWELGWLYLALRDLCEGLTPLGFGGAKGFGRVRLGSATLTLGRLGARVDGLGLRDDDYGPASGVFETCRLDWSDAGQRARLFEAAVGWVDDFRSRCLPAGPHTAPGARFVREEDFRLQADSYFGRQLEGDIDLLRLYPRGATQ